MIDVSRADRLDLLPLFEPVPRWRAFVHSAVERGMGKIRVDRNPGAGAAVLFYGGLVVYAGDPFVAGAEELVRGFPVQPLVLAWHEGWNELLRREFGDAVATARRYHLPFASHDRGASRSVLSASRWNPRPARADDFDRLDDDLGWEHHRFHYAGADDFIAHGAARLVEEEGRIVSGASAFCQSVRHVECQVTTRELQRRRGLASAAAAAFLEACYEAEKEIPWDAGNELSVRLARRLGYADVTEYKVFQILP